MEPTGQRANKKKRYGICKIYWTKCDDSYSIENTVNKQPLRGWKACDPDPPTRILNEFRDDIINLMFEWHMLVHWLAYRHTCSYWLGLVDWRRGKYTPDAYEPSSRSRHQSRPRSVLHRAKQALAAGTLLLRPGPADEGRYLELACSSFRQAQREHRIVFRRRLRAAERRCVRDGLVPGAAVRGLRRTMAEDAGGEFEIEGEFDPWMGEAGMDLTWVQEYRLVKRCMMCDTVGKVVRLEDVFSRASSPAEDVWEEWDSQETLIETANGETR